MAKFEIFQINIRDISDQINELGWAEASEKYERVQAHLDVGCGAEDWKPEYIRHYNLVAEIEAQGLEDVFRVGNLGPEEQITRLQPMHSLSVGDIVRDENGHYHLVDSFGFRQGIEVAR